MQPRHQALTRDEVLSWKSSSKPWYPSVDQQSNATSIQSLKRSRKLSGISLWPKSWCSSINQKPESCRSCNASLVGEFYWEIRKSENNPALAASTPSLKRFRSWDRIYKRTILVTMKRQYTCGIISRRSSCLSSVSCCYPPLKSRPKPLVEDLQIVEVGVHSDIWCRIELIRWQSWKRLSFMSVHGKKSMHWWTCIAIPRLKS